MQGQNPEEPGAPTLSLLELPKDSPAEHTCSSAPNNPPPNDAATPAISSRHSGDLKSTCLATGESRRQFGRRERVWWNDLADQRRWCGSDIGFWVTFQDPRVVFVGPFQDPEHTGVPIWDSINHSRSGVLKPLLARLLEVGANNFGERIWLHIQTLGRV